MVNINRVGDKFRYNICGEVVEVIEVGGGELICCGKPMNLVK